MIYIENKYDNPIDIDFEDIAINVINASIDYVKCPFDCEVNLLITNNDEVKKLNSENRDIDSPTDVLSFPAIHFEKPCEFSKIEDDSFNFNPESGELVLGDIVISYDKVIEQAKEYGHTTVREFAFLIAHSMLHLFGFDHINEEERKLMETEQESILNMLNYRRD